MTTKTEKALKAYLFDRQYLNQTNNEARYLINGKGVVRRDGGSYLFFAVEDDEVEFFHFGGTVLDVHLSELTLMPKEEQALLKLLIDIDKGFTDFGLHAVTGVFAMDDTGAQVLDEIVIYSPNNDAYCNINVLELENLTLDTVKELTSLLPCPLNSPHTISIAEDGSVIERE